MLYISKLVFYTAAIMWIRWLTAGFFAFIVLLIGAANTGTFQFLYRPVYALPMGDKVAHFLLIGCLALLLNLSLENRCFTALGRRWALGSVVVLVLATVEELSQLPLSRRDCSAGDWVADLLGILILGALAGLRKQGGNLSYQR